VKPRSAKRTTPIGSAKYVESNTAKLLGFISGARSMNSPITIPMIARTPHVSIFLSPFSPSLSNSVITSQNAIPKIMGLMLPGRSLEKLSPSPMRYAVRAEYTPNIVAKNMIRFPHGPRYFSA